MSQWRSSGLGVALALAIGACADAGASGPAPAECDAVLTHLLVLEGAQTTGDGPMCKYHPRCDGAEQERFRAQCPRVLARREASCYLTATTLGEIDACLPRSELDERIKRGEAGPADDLTAPAWLGEGGGTRGDRAVRKASGYAQQACACRDSACAAQARDRFVAWERTLDHADPDVDARRAELKETVDQLYECVKDLERYDPPDAGDPFAFRADGGLYDPYAYRPDAGLGAYTGIWECDTYRDSLERLLACASLPSYLASSLAGGFRDLRASWGDPYSMSYAARQSAAEQCKLMQQTLQHTAATSGCVL